MDMVREFGGQVIRFPKTEGGDIWAALEEVIGARATRTLCDTYGGEEDIYVPLCDRAIRAERNRQLIARYEDLVAHGHSSRGAISVLVREFRPISNRQVINIINAPTPAPSLTDTQGSLF